MLVGFLFYHESCFSRVVWMYERGPSLFSEIKVGVIVRLFGLVSLAPGA